ncbi:hypothetical protein H3146_24400 [Streptomyces sp. OF3]|uniref:Uncharacterized protein n=1 Tax=Streptomyces alkaliterrae TaxID=2213162 RepID=A0A7W3WQB4_9ACTN|nr:hypothetical protein [Streptomyces alkaliterrae]MBB1256469.1 hypothetical protein [Streptomyces alkaliterrae]
MNPDETEALRQALTEELANLWHDLDAARRSAYQGAWSMQCNWLERRIKRCTQLVGATPWERIQLPLLEDGIYQRIHADLGIEVTVDMEEVARVRESINRRGAREGRPA